MINIMIDLLIIIMKKEIINIMIITMIHSMNNVND